MNVPSQHKTIMVWRSWYVANGHYFRFLVHRWNVGDWWYPAYQSKLMTEVLSTVKFVEQQIPSDLQDKL